MPDADLPDRLRIVERCLAALAQRVASLEQREAIDHVIIGEHDAALRTPPKEKP